MSKKLQENEILEYLNTSQSVRSFFIATVEVFEQVIERSIERIFLKKEFAIKLIVAPLLEKHGPLNELLVRLKLLLGLGTISLDLYQDIERIIKLKNKLNKNSVDYKFTDQVIVEVIQALHIANNINMQHFEAITAAKDDIDLVFYQMQVDRQQQVIKSSLALTVILLCEALDKDSHF